ncbi:type I restriction-modification system subunit M N-terminal domain-containing protein [Halorussus pelagicus]|uniref:type I restriction-modification system subunit M N-terminal domain-containing protein n=1 Tax=Halorussus pelagicus TaxID=2505977 RepID=UPI000FFC8136
MTDGQQTLPGAEDSDDVLKLPTLRNYLWEVAELLRGSIDVLDYKNYIFRMLFPKRVNDRFEEETEETVARPPA